MKSADFEMSYANLAGLKVGEKFPARVMGVINVSPESFYKGSVVASESGISELALKMVKDGADIIDVGAMSTAPYIHTEISEEAELERMKIAIETIRPLIKVPISVDTVRSRVASEGLRAGADVINDVSGLNHDSEMCKVVASSGAPVIMMAFESSAEQGEPIDRVARALQNSTRLAKESGISEERIVIDPGIGFFRREGRGFGFSPVKEYPWYVWDCSIIRDISQLRSRIGRPVCLGVSRKSFIGKITGKEAAEERLAGSLAATAIAVYNGANMIRTHDVSQTIQAVKMVEAIRYPDRLRTLF
jgi:dihydropteroate synthase